MANKGRIYNLLNLFGWYDAAPNNFTKEERKRGGNMTWDGKGSVSQYYYNTVNPSQEWTQHQSELDEMVKYELVRPIIDLYAEECCCVDLNKKKTVWYTCNDMKIEKELNDMLERINVEDHIYSIAFSIAGQGNAFRRILRNEEGIQQIVAVDNREVERIWEPSTKRLLGYKWQGQTPYTPNDAISYLGDADLFSPWEFIHFRRISDNTSEYGVGLIEHLYGTYRKIKMAMDAMVVYRLHAMPTRHVFWLDSGNQTIFEMAQNANQLRNLLRNQVSIDPLNETMEQRYNPPATDSILFFPKRKDEEHKLEKMEGTRDVPDVHDLDLLHKQLFGGARIPKEYLGFGEPGSLGKASLVTQDMRFARMIRVLRMPILVGFKRLAELHLAFKGLDPKDYKIEVEMSKISSIEEEVNAATMSQQVSLASNLAQLCQSLDIPNKEIIDLIFKEYLHVPRKFIEIAKLAAAIQKAVNDANPEQGGEMGGEMGGMGGGGMGMGMGGGIGDMGTELGLDGGDSTVGGDDLSAAPPAAAGAASLPPPVESDSIKANLFENEEIASFLVHLRKVGKTLTESKTDKGAMFTEAIRNVKSNLNSLSSITQSKKTSLVEGSVITTGLTESYYMPEKANKEGFSVLKEATVKKDQFTKDLSEAASAPPKESKQPHPVLAMVRNMRAKQKS